MIRARETYPRMLDQLLPIPRTPERAARLATTLLIAAFLAIGVATAASGWHLADLQAYLAAGQLLATGGNPFEVVVWEQGLPYHYHYAPWFAAVFVPLAALPRAVVEVGWTVLLAGASIAALIPMLRWHGLTAVPIAGLMAFLLSNMVVTGNVQPLLLAGLVWTVERRAGPLAIGIAASLKLVPILLALVYVGRGEWRRAGVAVLVGGVLLAPSLFFDITPEATDTAGSALFALAPIAWGAMLLVGIGAALSLARTPHAWLAASTSTVLALPRLLAFDITNLVAALPAPRTNREDDR